MNHIERNLQFLSKQQIYFSYIVETIFILKVSLTSLRYDKLCCEFSQKYKPSLLLIEIQSAHQFLYASNIIKISLVKYKSKYYQDIYIRNLISITR